MKITPFRIYKTDLPYVGGANVWGAGNAIDTARASVVVIDTDAGLQGCGEMERYRADGYKHFQIKVGGDWAGDIDRIIAAVGFLNPGEIAMADANQGRRVDNAILVVRGVETCCLKLSNLGGISKARRGRDVLVGNRIPVVSEDTSGGEITTTFVVYFAASTSPEYLQNTTDLMNYNTRSTGFGGARSEGRKLYAPDTPGLGIPPDFERLGAPVSEYA